MKQNYSPTRFRLLLTRNFIKIGSVISKAKIWTHGRGRFHVLDFT